MYADNSFQVCNGDNWLFSETENCISPLPTKKVVQKKKHNTNKKQPRVGYV